MRILQVIPYFPPAYAFGGPVKAAYQISRELVKRGHEVVVYTTDAKDFGSRLKIDSSDTIDGIKVHRFRNISLRLVKKLKLFITPQLALSTRREIKEFDVIHLHEYRTFQNIVIHHYARKYDVPYVLQARGSLPRIGAWRKLKWFYDVLFGYRLLRGAFRVIALTKVEAEQCKHMGVSEEKIAIIPNGIDLSEYAELPPKGSFKKKFNIPEDRKIILYLGRIHKIKGIDFLIKTYAHLVNEMNFKDTALVVAGPDDGFLDEVKFLVQSLGISRLVMFTGPLYGKDKLGAYVDSDVVVLPSRYEAFPNVVLEAYACSKPVVASNVEAIPDIVLHGETGLLFQASDVKELASAIAYMLTRPEEAERMGCNARRLVEEKFSIDRIVTQLEALYEQVLKEKR
jgi:glycosyltransferase involved in cell wall biosynthesis